MIRILENGWITCSAENHVFEVIYQWFEQVGRGTFFWFAKHWFIRTLKVYLNSLVITIHLKCFPLKIEEKYRFVLFPQKDNVDEYFEQICSLSIFGFSCCFANKSSVKVFHVIDDLERVLSFFLHSLSLARTHTHSFPLSICVKKKWKRKRHLRTYRWLGKTLFKFFVALLD